MLVPSYSPCQDWIPHIGVGCISVAGPYKAGITWAYCSEENLYFWEVQISIREWWHLLSVIVAWRVPTLIHWFCRDSNLGVVTQKWPAKSYYNGVATSHVCKGIFQINGTQPFQTTSLCWSCHILSLHSGV